MIMSEFKTLDDKERAQRTGTSERQRLQLDFSSEAFERLAHIRELAGARNNAEVVRNALRVFEWFLEQKRANHKIQVVTDSSVKEVELLL
jgi:hypothetical protein